MMYKTRNVGAGGAGTVRCLWRLSEKNHTPIHIRIYTIFTRFTFFLH